MQDTDDRYIDPYTAEKIARFKKRAYVALDGMHDFVKRKLEELGGDACVDDEYVWNRIARTADVLRKIGWPEVYVVEEIAEQLPVGIYLRSDLQGWFELVTKPVERPFTQEEIEKMDADYWAFVEKMAGIWAARNAKNG